MAVRAGGRIFVAGLSGRTLDGRFTGLGDPAAQADQAMANARALLDEAGASLPHVRRVTTYLTDRAWREQVEAVIAGALGGVAPARVALIVAGLAQPEMLVAIDIEAEIAA